MLLSAASCNLKDNLKDKRDKQLHAFECFCTVFLMVLLPAKPWRGAACHTLQSCTKTRVFCVRGRWVNHRAKGVKRYSSLLMRLHCGRLRGVFTTPLSCGCKKSYQCWVKYRRAPQLSWASNMLCEYCFTSRIEIDGALNQTQPAIGALVPQDVFSRSDFGEDQLNLILQPQVKEPQIIGAFYQNVVITRSLKTK